MGRQRTGRAPGSIGQPTNKIFNGEAARGVRGKTGSGGTFAAPGFLLASRLSSRINVTEMRLARPFHRRHPEKKIEPAKNSSLPVVINDDPPRVRIARV